MNGNTNTKEKTCTSIIKPYIILISAIMQYIPAQDKP
jgi:hypothetical protein